MDRECRKCELCRTRFHVVPDRLLADAKVSFIARNPGIVEDKSGTEPLLGPAGQFFTKVLHEVGLSRREVSLLNVVKCRTPDDRPPAKEEIAACTPWLEESLSNTSPNIIVTMGTEATQYILKTKKKISKLRGQVEWSDIYKCKVLPTFHPSYVLRNPATTNSFVRDLKKAVEEMGTHDVAKAEAGQYLIIKTKKQVESIREKLKSVDVFSLDLETTGLDFMKDEILGVCISWKEGTGVYIPIQGKGQEWEEFVYTFLKEALNGPQEKVVHNGKFDLKFLVKKGIEVTGPVFDTMLALYLLDENRGNDKDEGGSREGYSLKKAAWDFTDMGGYEKPLEEARKEYAKEHKMPLTKVPFSVVPLEVLGIYGCQDSDCTLRLRNIFTPRLEQQKLRRLFRQLTMNLSEALMSAEVHGVLIDKEYLLTLRDKFTCRVEEIKKRSVEQFGDVNLGSSKQLATLLFDRLKLPITKVTGTGLPSTDKETLDGLTSRHPFIKELREYKQLTKLISTYLEGFIDLLDKDSRVHTTFHIPGTATGRLSSSGPNLQNIPSGKVDDDIQRERAVALRNMVVSSPGYSLAEFDHKAAEVRIIAGLSGDEGLLEILRSGLDIHRSIASEVLNVSYDKVTDEQRSIAKQIVFGLNYGRQAPSLAEQLEISEVEAQRFINKYFERFKGVERWMKRTQIEVKKTGQVTNLFGRIRRLPGVLSSDRDIREEALRQAINSPVQGSAVDLTNLGLVRCYQRFKQMKLPAYIIMQIHDSIIFEIADEILDDTIKIVKEEMTRPVTGFTIPLAVDVKVGKRLGEMKELQEVL